MGDRLSGVRPWRRTIQAVPVAAPAAGADWSITVPGAELWRVLAIYGELTSDANVANRDVQLVVTLNGATIMNLPYNSHQTAGSTNTYTWAPYVDSRSPNTRHITALPELRLLPGATIAAATGSIQAGDQWANVVIYAEVTTAKRGDIDLDVIPSIVVDVAELPTAG